MLVDLAYERIERLVRGETDIQEEEEMGEDEDEEASSWSRPMLATLRKEVQRQVVAWLYTYISGKSFALACASRPAKTLHSCSAGNERDYQRKTNIDARIEYALQSALFEHR